MNSNKELNDIFIDENGSLFLDVDNVEVFPIPFYNKNTHQQVMMQTSHMDSIYTHLLIELNYNDFKKENKM